MQPGLLTRTSKTIMALAGVLMLVAAPPAEAGKGRHRDHPGYVDGTRFVEYADADGELIEVTLHGRLLSLLGDRAIRRHDAALADILSGLVSLHAVIADLGEGESEDADPRDVRRARTLVTDYGAYLADREWERFVRVREGASEEIMAFVHFDREDEIDGLVVMGMTGGNELLFVNLAGRIDMEAVSVLGDRFDLPGLDGLPKDDEIKKQRRDRVKISGHTHVHIDR